MLFALRERTTRNSSLDTAARCFAIWEAFRQRIPSCYEEPASRGFPACWQTETTLVGWWSIDKPLWPELEFLSASSDPFRGVIGWVDGGTLRISTQNRPIGGVVWRAGS
jgi:hypothetical protein